MLLRCHCIKILLCLGSLAQTLAAQTHSADSLRFEIYHGEEILALPGLPAAFPRHRPARLLLLSSGRVPSRASLLQVADSLAALRKLAGLPYYSHTEKKMIPLFKTSEVLAYPSAQHAASDPRFRALPLDTSLYVRQIDNRLGEVIYRLELHASDHQLTFSATNVVPIEKFGLQLAEMGDDILFIAIQKQGGYLDYTVWQWLRFRGGLLGIFVKEESFVNRLRAVLGFYLDMLRER